MTRINTKDCIRLERFKQVRETASEVGRALRARRRKRFEIAARTESAPYLGNDH